MAFPTKEIKMKRSILPLMLLSTPLWAAPALAQEAGAVPAHSAYIFNTLLFLIGGIALLVTAGAETGFLWHLAVRS